MEKVSVIIFYILLSVIFLSEGLGLSGGRQLAMALILFMPLFLFVFAHLQKKKLSVPSRLTVLYCLFLSFVLLSTILSRNPSRSLYHFFYAVSLYMIFLFVYNFREQLKLFFLPWICSVSILFIFYSLMLNAIRAAGNVYFIPENGYQFVFSRFGSHNHLSDFLLLPLILCTYNLFKKIHIRLSIVGIVVLLPFFIFSYSRSAYLSYIVTLVVMLFIFRHSVIKRGTLWIVGAVVLLISIFFVATVREASSIPMINTVHEMLSNNFHLTSKTLTAKRDLFAVDAIASIVNKPIFGVGPNNYVLISGPVFAMNFFTYTSHNLFLDIAVEIGLVGLLCFICFLFEIIKHIDRRSVFFFLLLSMLFNFQTDYTFRIYSFFLLFFVILALGLQKEKEKNTYVPIGFLVIISLFLFISGQFLLFNGMLPIQ